MSYLRADESIQKEIKLENESSSQFDHFSLAPIFNISQNIEASPLVGPRPPREIPTSTCSTEKRKKLL